MCAAKLTEMTLQINQWLLGQHTVQAIHKQWQYLTILSDHLPPPITSLSPSPHSPHHLTLPITSLSPSPHSPITSLSPSPDSPSPPHHLSPSPHHLTLPPSHHLTLPHHLPLLLITSLSLPSPYTLPSPSPSHTHLITSGEVLIRLEVMLCAVEHQQGLLPPLGPQPSRLVSRARH